jgi:hypothetical protein
MVENLADYAEYLQQLSPLLESLPQKSKEELLKDIELSLKKIEQVAIEQGVTLPALPVITINAPDKMKKQIRQKMLNEYLSVFSDLPDTMLEDLDHIRHSSSPTPPIEEQLKWLSEE